ncbi:MAG: hypothetical protein LBO04_05000 [Spirochaetaceae bacterium]|jgi:hypothetical protein|nr:hypothetical protein [Spirochaetaceae bacterium]
MKALVFGLVLIAAAVVAVIPAGLNWLPQLVVFIQGGLPVAAALVGLLALFIGVADINDRAEAKKEKQEPEGS